MAEDLFAADSVLDWLNNAIDADGLANVDQKITVLSSSLDIAAEESSIQLERIIDDVSRAVPRLTYDIHFMRDSALSLQSALTQVHQKSSDSVSEQTADALERLHTLDRIKRNMEAARDVLREAESWGSLEMEVTSLLAEQSYAKAAERLSEASKSMVVFQNTPEYGSRHSLMVNLQNQLEASLSSALVAAINAQDVEKCREHYAIFCNVQREPEFRNYYFGSRRATLVSLWQDTTLIDCEPAEEGAQTPFTQFLPTFYEQLLLLLNQECVSIPAIFPNPAVTMSAFVISIFGNLQPTFSQRLESLSTYHGTSLLKQLILAFKSTEDLVASVEKVMEKAKFSALLATPHESSESVPPQSSPKRRRSVRRSMSMSFRSGQRASLGPGNTLKLPFLEDLDSLDWDQELLQPFVDFQVDYGTLEKKLLEDLLQTYMSNVGSVAGSQARVLRERMNDVIGIAEESISRCLSFTYGYGALGLIQALDHHFKTFVNTWAKDMSAPSSVPTSTDLGLADLDYTAQDWSNFQSSIHLLTSARGIHERLTLFETQLRGTLTQVSGQFRLAHSDSSHIMTSSRREHQLLEQSSLNSLELQNLFNTIDPEPTHSREHLLPPTPGTGSFRHHQHPPNIAPPMVLLTDAHAAISDFAKACQTSIQTTLLSPLRQHLSSYASSGLWSVPGDLKVKKVGELQIPNFSFSPTDAVQRVAEGLLNLPRLFEVYAEDDAFSFSLSTLPHIDAETLKGLAEMTAQSEVSSPYQGHLRRPSLAPTQRPSFSLDPEAVSSAWLTSLGNSLLSHLVKSILPNIASLSPAGAAQLSSDLGYLTNIVRAINVDFDDLGKWKEWVDLEDEEGKRLWNERQTLDPVFGLVARMRGWAK